MPLTAEQAQHLLDRIEAARGDAFSDPDLPVTAVVGILAGLHQAEQIVRQLIKEE